MINTKMIPITFIPKDEIRNFRLSDNQWKNLIETIEPTKRPLIGDARGDLDHDVRNYLWSIFNAQHAVRPSELSVPLIELEESSGHLISLLEKYFFPAHLPYSDALYSEQIMKRVSEREITHEEPLILEKPRSRTTDDYSTSQRNELIRTAMMERLSFALMPEFWSPAKIPLSVPFTSLETILKNIIDLQVATQKALDTLPSARGDHGAPHLDNLISKAQDIYRKATRKGGYLQSEHDDSKGDGFYSKGGRRFIIALLGYVCEFARPHISPDITASIDNLLQDAIIERGVDDKDDGLTRKIKKINATKFKRK